MTFGKFVGTLQDQHGNRLVVGVDGLTLVPAGQAPGPTPVPGPTPSPSVRPSGLPWDSGVFANDKTMPARFTTLRLRRIDTADVHTEAVDVGNPYWLRGYTPASVGTFTLSCPLTTAIQPSAWAKAAQALAAAGFRGRLARLRPGVEFNLANESRATDSTVDAWMSRFRAAANTFRANNPGALICLCVNEGKGSGQVSDANVTRIADTLLRDGSADELGVDFYDQWPPMFSAQDFERRVNGGFGSLGWWADFAQARGKKVSVPEWGTGRNDPPGQWAGHAGGDNPVFVSEMIAWFRRNAHRLGYEAYFAEPAAYIANDITTQMPKSRDAYVAALR